LEDERPARLIGFYMPQFHPIPENDAWWGPGFTEWTNVSKARPLFPGHEQPNIPTDLGYYDLRIPEVREQQAALAKKYGLEGFCYWHYWFNGKLLLEKPFQEVLASGKPDFPFCLAWANEPWSRRWTGEPTEILQDQTYGGAADGRRHFDYLLPAFQDKRAIKINGKPVFLIYKANLIPNIRNMLAEWRELAQKHGLPGVYLMSIETTGTYGRDPRSWGFDAAVEFQPHWFKCVRISSKLAGIWRRTERKIMNRLRPGTFGGLKYGLRVWDYRKLWPHLLTTQGKDYPFYPGIFPRWDNTPRSGKDGLVISNSSPQEYGRWLQAVIERLGTRPREHRIVFINAWNEWAEGNYLEPDQKFGRAYLEATDLANSPKE